MGRGRQFIKMNKEDFQKEKKIWLQISWLLLITGIILSIISIYLILNKIITLGYSTRYQSLVFNNGWPRLFLGVLLVIGGMINIKKLKKK